MFVLGVWAAAWAIGCSSGASSGAGGADASADAGADGDEPAPTPAEAAAAFCTAYQADLCQRVATCGCGDAAVSACQSATDSCIAGLPAFQTALQAGTVTFDRDAAEAILSRLAASRDCGAPLDVLGFTVGDWITWGGVVGGTVEAGGECGLLDGSGVISTCRNGLCLDGTCVAVGGPDDACDASTLCLHTDGPAALLVEGTAASSCDDETGRCRGAQPTDGPCHSGVDCQSGYCDGARCAERVANGERCFLGTDCQSGHCNIATSQCEPPLAAAAECIDDSDCASGYCRKESGATRGACDAPGALGRPCLDDEPAGCESGACSGGVCVQPLCLGFLGG